MLKTGEARHHRDGQNLLKSLIFTRKGGGGEGEEAEGRRARKRMRRGGGGREREEAGEAKTTQYQTTTQTGFGREKAIRKCRQHIRSHITRHSQS